MSKLKVRPITLILFLSLFLSVPKVSIAAEISEDLEANILKRIEWNMIPGLIIGIVDEQGMRHYGYGEVTLDEGLKPDKDTVYEIGSITKTFTSTILSDMSLKEEVSLNDPVQSLLPDSVEVPQRKGKQISLVQLSTHRSSLPRMPSNFSPENPKNPYADYTVQNMYDFLSSYTLKRNIGKKSEYSNLGYGLLGHALALQAETTYETLVSERILRPLSMDSSGINFTDSMSERLATPYAVRNGALSKDENWDIASLAGAGAIRSTTDDMLKYLSANIGLLDSPLRSAMKLAQESREEMSDGSDKIGLGWIVSKKGNDFYHWHNGGTGGYRAFIGMSIENKRGVVVLTNSTSSIDDIGFHLLNPNYSLNEPELQKERIEINLPEDQLQKLVGSYRLTRNFTIKFTVENGRLYGQGTDQPRFEVFAESPTQFFWKDVDAQVTFELDENDVGSRMTLHQNGRNLSGKKLKSE